MRRRRRRLREFPTSFCSLVGPSDGAWLHNPASPPSVLVSVSCTVINLLRLSLRRRLSARPVVRGTYGVPSRPYGALPLLLLLLLLLLPLLPLPPTTHHSRLAFRRACADRALLHLVSTQRPRPPSQPTSQQALNHPIQSNPILLPAPDFFYCFLFALPSTLRNQ